MTYGTEAAVPGLMLEWVDAADIGVDPALGTVPDLVLWCMGAVAQIAVDAGRTTVVLTGDLVSSVKSRLGEHPSAETYDLSRGSGIVAAKTMLLPDGTINVLLHAHFFHINLTEEEQVGAAKLMKRTIVHEAQHVAMRQNKQSYEHRDESNFRDLNLRSAADSVIDEYRAELGVPMSLREDEAPWFALDTLDALGEGLGHAVAAYQEHLDVARLALDVGTVTLYAWRAFAYMLALEKLDAGQPSVSRRVTEDARWEGMAAAPWPKLKQLLWSVPSGTAVMKPIEIKAAVEGLAGVLLEWLEVLGFVWTSEKFSIQPWYFDDHYFRLALASSQD